MPNSVEVRVLSPAPRKGNMSYFVLHHNGAFNLYLTATDSPSLENGVTEDGLRDYVKLEYGNHGLRSLDVQIERAKATGTSSLMDTQLEELVRFNRCGLNRKGMPLTEFIQKYLTL